MCRLCKRTEGVRLATAGQVSTTHARNVIDELDGRRLRFALDPAYGLRDPVADANLHTR
jgi:hypothetical protein